MRGSWTILVLMVMALAVAAPLAAGDAHGDCDGPGGNVALGIIVIGSGRADSTTAYVDDRN